MFVCLYIFSQLLQGNGSHLGYIYSVFSHYQVPNSVGLLGFRRWAIDIMDAAGSLLLFPLSLPLPAVQPCPFFCLPSWTLWDGLRNRSLRNSTWSSCVDGSVWWSSFVLFLVLSLWPSWCLWPYLHTDMLCMFLCWYFWMSGNITVPVREFFVPIWECVTSTFPLFFLMWVYFISFALLHTHLMNECRFSGSRFWGITLKLSLAPASDVS